jgi:hypothetical protein
MLITLTIASFEIVLSFCIVLYGISVGLYSYIITFLKRFNMNFKNYVLVIRDVTRILWALCKKM